MVTHLGKAVDDARQLALSLPNFWTLQIYTCPYRATTFCIVIKLGQKKVSKWPTMP